MTNTRKDLIIVNKLQKILSLLLALLLLQAPVLSLADEAEVTETEPEATEAPADVEFPEELIVGHPTITKGDFFTELFGNDTADIDVRALIHGYNLVNWDQNQGTYVIDPSVVTEYKVTMDEVGNKTYDMLIADDLYYSDGTQITAWDYAFSILLMMSPEIEDPSIGGKIYRAEHLLGYDDYIATRKKVVAGEPLDLSPEGDVLSLSGVEVRNDYELVITLDADFLPYFFETGLLMTVPYPIKVIAPGCKVYDEGFGVYIGNEDQNDTTNRFTVDLLKKTILDPETGYNSHPSVVSGPYIMKSWDKETGEGHYEINPYFKGAWYHNNLPGPDYSGPVRYIQVLDEEGVPKLDTSGSEIWLVKPTIEKIAFVEADNDTMIQKLADGELHLVNKVTYGPTIREGMQGDVSKEAGLQFQNYPRIGLSFLTFTYDWPTVHDMEVRQAIAYCMDRDLLTNEYCGYSVEGADTKVSFGTRVDGYFGIEQWEYLLVTGQMDYPVNFLDQVVPPVTEVLSAEDEEAREEKRKEYLKKRNLYATSQEEYDMYIAAWQALTEEWQDKLTKYSVDLDKANALLDKAGWTYNREGGAYQAGKDDVRCKKMEDGTFLPMDLKMLYPEGNHMAEIMMEAGKDEIAVEGRDWSKNFIDNLARVGIKLELVPAPMADLLKAYYRETERTTDMIYLATNFHVIVDPSITYSTDKTKNHEIWNNTYSDDELLWNDAVNMRRTEPGDIFEYVSKWVAFQERYNEVLPTIPIYSNIYFDFFNQYLQNYYITGQVTWSQAILPAYFALESYETVPEETEGEGAEDTESFED